MMARACFEVSAGVIPGQPIPALTRQWWYTEEDHQEDLDKIGKIAQDTGGDPIAIGMARQETTFQTARTEAHAYAQSITDPQCLLNWVRVDWIWF